MFQQIEARCEQTAAVGALPLWDGYFGLENYPKNVSTSAVRSSNQVRTARKTGMFYSAITASLKPKEVVEIGTAFGVSGMYWCAGLSMNGFGRFTGFEPNTAWSPYAKSNVSAILDHAQVIEGTFEENQNSVPETIDLAFIDAIHTPEFVEDQLNLVLERAREGTVIVLDDIRFSSQMTDYWLHIRDDDRFSAAFEYTRRVGFLEIAG